MDEDDFITLYGKLDLGYEEDELSNFFKDADKDGDGVLSLWEQDKVWHYLMSGAEG